jgi:hypothetical protein
MATRFCRDCVNFEERRDVDGNTLCRKNVGPYACCEDFETRNENKNPDRLYHKFCVECVNFEDVDTVPVCTKNHIRGTACQEFKSRFEKLKATRHKKNVNTVLVTHIAKEVFEFEPLPTLLIEIGQKTKW